MYKAFLSKNLKEKVRLGKVGIVGTMLKKSEGAVSYALVSKVMNLLVP
jgi:hypothetical protein